jgi:hypothetical protein
VNYPAVNGGALELLPSVGWRAAPYGVALPYGAAAETMPFGRTLVSQILPQDFINLLSVQV